MNLLPPTSSLRCLPMALPLKVRRLLAGMAYALDGAELSLGRLRTAAEGYVIPTRGVQPGPGEWQPATRLGVVVDAWSFVDHVSRVRKLIGRFEYEAPEAPAEVVAFLQATKEATDIRNRLQHLDEDVFTGANCDEGHPILGTVSWTDARSAGGVVRYSISTGPGIEAGKMGEFVVKPGAAGTVCDFRLMAADHRADLDGLHKSVSSFATWLDSTLTQSFRGQIVAHSAAAGVPLDRLAANAPTDTIMAMRFQENGEGGWTWCTEGSRGLTEVPPGSYLQGLQGASGDA